MKPIQIPNVVGFAKIQVINESTWKWQTLVECIDAPNPIAREVKRLTGLGWKNLWVCDAFGERTIF